MVATTMTVKEHYDNHLGHFYSWMAGDFEENRTRFRDFCNANGITPTGSARAIDLGAGHGIQTLALADLGFRVTAIDFNQELLDELSSRINNLPVEVVRGDIRQVREYAASEPGLIVCCGDTLPHLASEKEINQLISDVHQLLSADGKFVLTFRDYSSELQDTDRFIPVKSDSTRILTCFLEYFEDRLRVTDLLYEFENDRWVPKVSSYFKTRTTQSVVVQALQDAGFEILLNEMKSRMITIVAGKRMS